jgi:hypothetical protein
MSSRQAGMQLLSHRRVLQTERWLGHCCIPSLADAFYPQGQALKMAKVRSMQGELSEDEYTCLYPTKSHAGALGQHCGVVWAELLRHDQ